MANIMISQIVCSRLAALLCAGGLVLNPGSVKAGLYEDGAGGLGVTGVSAAAKVGGWPLLSRFSWINRGSTGGQSTISWRLHPGTDGGIVFFLAQPPETLTSEFTMLNLLTTLYSIGGGITIENDMIDMSNLRKRSNGVVLNIGSAPGIDSLIPLVNDITALLPGENGWQLNPDGSYYLIFNTLAECAGCGMVIHLYGDQLPRIALGDINLDKRVNVGDVVVAERYLMGLTNLTPAQIAQGDIAPQNIGDGEIKITDLLQIIRQVQTRY